jgi:hypothetical protein
MFWKPAWSTRWLPPKTGCLGQRVLGYADQSHGDVDVWQDCGRAPAAGSPESRAFPCEDLLDLGHYVARAFGSKFRAITPGHPGEVMVTHGPSKEGDALHPRDKAAGQRPSDLQFCGGQGRGRTADLPIFSWSYETGIRQWSRPQSHRCRAKTGHLGQIQVPALLDQVGRVGPFVSGADLLKDAVRRLIPTT